MEKMCGFGIFKSKYSLKKGRFEFYSRASNGLWIKARTQAVLACCLDRLVTFANGLRKRKSLIRNYGHYHQGDNSNRFLF